LLSGTPGIADLFADLSEDIAARLQRLRINHWGQRRPTRLPQGVPDFARRPATPDPVEYLIALGRRQLVSDGKPVVVITGDKASYIPKLPQLWKQATRSPSSGEVTPLASPSNVSE
jgi:hypothetical protein